MQKTIRRSITIEGLLFERSFAPHEQAMLKRVDPLFFLAEGGKDPVYALHALQKSFHVLLRKYLKLREEDFFSVARREVVSCRFFIAKVDAEYPLPSPEDPAGFICAVYAALRTLHPVFGRASTEVKKFNLPFELEPTAAAHPSRHYRTIAALKCWAHTHLKPYVSSFVVHGSFATGDFIDGWSDLDTGVVVREEVVTNPALLRAARRALSRAGLLCYLIDPLAHHELMVFTHYDIEYYLDDTLPIAAWEQGLRLLGDKSLTFVRRDSSDERSHRLFWYAAWYRDKIERHAWARDLMNWKNEAGTPLLMPAIGLEAFGTYVYKRESFMLAKERYPQLPWDCVDRASALRIRWSVESPLQRIPPALLLQGPADFGRRAFLRLLRPLWGSPPLESPAFIEELMHDSLGLMEDILSLSLESA